MGGWAWGGAHDGMDRQLVLDQFIWLMMARCLLLLLLFTVNASLGQAQASTVSLEVDSYSISEDTGNLTVIIIREGNISTPVVVQLEAKGISNDDRLDFDLQPTLQEIQLLPEETRKEVIIHVIDDQLPEDDELFILCLSYSGTEVLTLLLTEANVTIVDDDKFEIGFEPVDYTADEVIGRVTLIINSSIPNPGPDEIILRIRTMDGTAIVGEDYRSVEDYVIFAPMEQVREYDVEIFDDQKVEPNLEMFFVVLEFLPDRLRERIHNPGLTLGQSTASIFIIDTNNVAMQLDKTSVRVDENFGGIMITIFKQGQSEINVSLQVDTRMDAATEITDYMPIHQRIIFQPQDTERNMTIRIIDDNVLEEDEAFQLELSVPEGEPVTLLQPNHIAVIKILNNDVVQFHFEREMYFIQESFANATLVIIKEGSNDIPVTVAIETQSLEAKAGEDFESVFVMLTFEHGDVNRSVSVPLIDDDTIENLERFFVTATSSQVGVEIISPQRTAIIITNDDSITAGFSQFLYTVGEGDQNISVHIYKSGQNQASIILQLSTRDDSAIEGEDYLGYSDMLEIGPSLENDTFSVLIPILNDELIEPTETFIVELLSVGSGAHIENGSGDARIDIIDNDVAAIGFAKVSYTVCEEDGARVLLNITKQGPVTGSVTLQYFTLAGQAKDFVPVQPTAVILHEDEVSATVSVELVNDEVVEGSEVMFVRLALAAHDIPGIQLAADTASVIITDKDVAMVGFEMQNITVQESSGEVTFHVLKSGLAAVQLSVRFTTEDLEATAPLDYIPITKLVTFKPSEVEKLITVILVNDGTFEGKETFSAKLTAVSSNVQIGTNADSVVTITDEKDVTVIGFEVTELTAEETLPFGVIATVALFQGQAEREFVVGVMTLNGTAKVSSDFILLTSNLTFGPSDVRVPVIIEVVNDGYAEFTEQISFELVSYEDNVLVHDTNKTLYLTITDQTDFQVGFEATEVALHENDTLKLGIGVLAGAGTEIPFSISYFTASGTAQDGEDYIESMGTFTFAPREQRKVMQVPIINDALLENKEEIFFIRLMITSFAPGLLVGASTVTVTIIDDDFVVAGFEVAEMSVEETTTPEISVQVVLLQNQADREITIGLRTVDGSAQAFDDYLPISTNLTFQPFQTFISVSLSIINNEFAEAVEQFSITLVSYEEDIRIHDDLLITIVDNRDIFFGFDQAFIVTGEANGTVVLNIGLRGGAVRDPFLVRVYTIPQSAEGYAEESSDYSRFVGVYTFSLPNQQSSIEIQIINDTILEEDEQFLVGFSFLSFVPVLSFQEQALVTILDDDTITVGFEQTDAFIDENAFEAILNFRVVVLQGLAQRQFVVSVHSQEGTATVGDFILISEILTFESYQVNQMLLLSVINDTVWELDEQFSLVLESEDEAVFIQDGRSTLQVTIQDQTDIGFGFESLEVTVQESDHFVEATMGFIGGGTSALSFNVSFTTRDGTAIGSLGGAPDFINTADLVVFAPYEQMNTIRIPIIDDSDLEEYSEYFFVELLHSPNMYVVLGSTELRVTIIDDDFVVLGFQVTEMLVEETTSEVMVEVVLLEGRSKREFTIGVQTRDGSATGINDYFPIASNLTFAPLQSTGNVSIQIIDDGIAEPNEQFLVMLQSYENAVQLSTENSILNVSIEAHNQTVVSVPVCKVEDSILITPFQDPGSTQQSYTYHGTCEHILLENCLLNPSDFRITVDFVSSNLDIGRVGVKLRNMEVVILEDFSTRLTNAGDPIPDNSTLRFSDGIVIHSDNDNNMVVVELQTLGVILTRSVGLVSMSLTGAGSLHETCGLCGDQSGSLLFSDRTKEAIISNRSSIELFADSWRVNPGEQFLRESSKECGFVSSDTVIGDPLFTVPLYDAQGSTPTLEKATKSSPPALCFEVHGASNKVFNLVSDRCTTVNALFAPMNVPENGNIIRSVGIRSVDRTGQCVDITVGLENGCIPRVSTNHSSAVETERYSSQGVSVSRHQDSRARVSVPNCENLQLVMWVVCELVNGQEMIKFVITRGINLRPTSHGLLGQFWNIPITFESLNYTGSDLHLAREYFDLERAYTVTVYPPSAPLRSFVGELYWRSWDRQAIRCYYAGNAQGGPVREFEQTPADSVIQGKYTDYQIENILGTEFTYSMFDEQYCQ